MKKLSRGIKTVLLLALLTASLTGATPVSAQNFVPSSRPVGQQPYCVAVADVNGDGKPDLISADQSVNLSAGTVTVLTNNGNGSFSYSSTYQVGYQPTFVLATDVNGDGKTDLITANFGNGADNLTVLTNNGDGTFTLSATFAVGPNPFNVASLNVKGGALVDLVSANLGSDTLTVLTNDAHGNFTTSQTVTVGNSPTVSTADVNGDGLLDLISANYSDNTLSVFTNNGTGSFVFSQTLNTDANPSFAAPADVNGDGKTDLICVCYGANDVIVFTNAGGGVFMVSATNTVGQNPFWVAAADLNRDGKVDLVTANYGDNNDFSTPGTLTVLTNAGGGVFNFSQTQPVGVHPVYVTGADLNGDGAQDVVSANFSDNNLTLLSDLPLLNLQVTSPGAATISWPDFWPGYVLQEKTSLTASSWVSVNNPTGTNHLIISPITGNGFFRLRHP